ncbi:unnamed protein product [Withania somnifera]
MEREKLTLVTRKSSFGLPTSCPDCLPVYIYLKFSGTPFDLDFNLINPDSAQIPYVESGTYVAYNNEKGGVIRSLIEGGFVDLDSQVCGIPEWISTKAMVDSWLADATIYELWVGSDGTSARKIYYSDLPWPLGNILYLKQVHVVKQILGITKDSAERREEEETSVLRSKLLEYDNLVRYIEKYKSELVDSSASSSSGTQSQSDLSSSVPRRPSRWNSKPKSKPKREKTEEEKKFRRRAKYFLVTQLVAVLVFHSLLGGSDVSEVELDEDDDGVDYD